MGITELIQAAADDFAARVRDADAESLLTSEAFSFGMGDRLMDSKAAEIERRIDAMYGEPDGKPIVERYGTARLAE